MPDVPVWLSWFLSVSIERSIVRRNQRGSDAGLVLGAFPPHARTDHRVHRDRLAVLYRVEVSPVLAREDVYDRLKLTRGLPYAISTVLHYVVLAIWIFRRVGALGVDMTKFTILAGAFSVGVGFGLQNVINNFRVWFDPAF